MMRSLLRSEWSKIKGKGLWLLAALGPIGVIGLTMVNYGVRKDYLLAQSDDDWAYYLDGMLPLTAMALVLGIAIITSLLASIEGQTNAWKLWLALPIRRSTVYMSKFIIATVLLLVSSVVLALGTTIYGMTLGLGEPIPWLSILEYSFYPWLSAQAIIALHLWSAVVSSNQGFTVSLGVIGVIVAIMSPYAPDWVVWKWPFLIIEGASSWSSIAVAISISVSLLLIGLLHFSRKDVA